MQDCGSERLTKDEVDFITQSVESFEVETTIVEKSLSPKMIFVGLNGVGRTEPDRQWFCHNFYFSKTLKQKFLN